MDGCINIKHYFHNIEGKKKHVCWYYKILLCHLVIKMFWLQNYYLMKALLVT